MAGRGFGRSGERVFGGAPKKWLGRSREKQFGSAKPEPIASLTHNLSALTAKRSVLGKVQVRSGEGSVEAVSLTRHVCGEN
jgi:hypothetical protein